MTRHEKWVLTGRDEETGVNPPFNPRVPTPRHYHPEPPHFDERCGECLQLQEKRREESAGRER